MAISFCTLAIHPLYRERARLLCEDLAPWPVIVLTDEPSDFADLPVRAIKHAPTGPMAVDYLARLLATGNQRGAAAYHDKRFALQAALADFETTIFLDADSRINGPLPSMNSLPMGLAITNVVRNSVAGHLETSGSWRYPAFEELGRLLIDDFGLLQRARWCHESCLALTRNGREKHFFAAWDQAADFLQARGVFSGEGGVIGMAAAATGLTIDDEAIVPLAACIQHEGGGPKETFLA